MFLKTNKVMHGVPKIFAFSYLIGPQVGIHTYSAYGITGLSIGCASIFGFVYFMLMISTIPEGKHGNDEKSKKTK